MFIYDNTALCSSWNVKENRSCTENQNTHFMSNNLPSEKSSVYEIMWKNMVELDNGACALHAG